MIASVRRRARPRETRRDIASDCRQLERAAVKLFAFTSAPSGLRRSNNVFHRGELMHGEMEARPLASRDEG